MHDLKSVPMLASDYLYSGYVQTRCNLPCSRDDLSAAIVRCIVSAAGSYISAFWANRMIDLKRFEIIPEIQNRVFLRHIARLETRSSAQAKRPCSEKKHSVETAD